jgi:hypothetical protein
LITIQTTAKKIPIAGSLVTVAEGTVAAAVKTAGKIPGVRQVADGVRRGFGKAVDAVPIASNAKRGVSNAIRAQNKK